MGGGGSNEKHMRTQSAKCGQAKQVGISPKREAWVSETTMNASAKQDPQESEAAKRFKSEAKKNASAKSEQWESKAT